ncbi:MAG: hypothetical protein ACE5R6_18125 [Candidatus Heimdallarchaeota archaeon]
MLKLLERFAKKKAEKITPKTPPIAPKIPTYQRTPYLDELKTLFEKKKEENRRL